MEIQIDSAPTRWNSGGSVLPRNTFLAAGDRHRPEATSLERTVALIIGCWVAAMVHEGGADP